MDNENTFENAVYNQILAIYEEKLGLSLTDDPIIYRKLIEIVNLLKDQKNNNPEHIREIITNAIVLILSLFFNKKDKDDDFDELPELTSQDRKNIKQILGDTWAIMSHA